MIQPATAEDDLLRLVAGNFRPSTAGSADGSHGPTNRWKTAGRHQCASVPRLETRDESPALDTRTWLSASRLRPPDPDAGSRRDVCAPTDAPLLLVHRRIVNERDAES